MADELEQSLIALAEIPDRLARGVRVGGPRGESFIVARRGSRAFVYRNRCPHRGSPLDWTPDHFMDESGYHLVCATHGAIFRKDDGECISGPCTGDRLEPIAARVENGIVLVDGMPPEL